MKLTRRGLLAAGSAVALAGCGSPQRGALTVGLTWIPHIQFSPFYLAERDGLFTDAGLDVTLRHHGEQEDVFGALQRGQEQVVFAAADELMLARTNAPELRAFATLYQRYPGAVLVPEASPVREPAQLRGRTVGIPGRFGSSYLAALSALRRGGLKEDDVTLTDIGFTQVSALMTGRVDAVVGFTNNEAVQLQASGFPVRTIAVQDEQEPWLVGHGLICRDGDLPGESLSALADAVRVAEERILASPELGLDASTGYLPTLADQAQRRTARQVLEATSSLWQQDGRVSVANDASAFERMEQFLLESDLLSAPVGTSVLES